MPAVKVRWVFWCPEKLPEEPVGVGHKRDALYEVLTDPEGRKQEQTQQALGKGRPMCATHNYGAATLKEGNYPVRCAYCGAPAFVLLVVASELGEPIVLLRQCEVDPIDLTVEAVDDGET